jgi:predicted urease superfamily metal-dependent hydrolase
MKTTVEMAREAQLPYFYQTGETANLKQLEAFAELVRADEAEKYKWDIHSCGPTCKRYACVAMREAVQAEREACAKVVESHGTWFTTETVAAAIRARGDKHD